MLLQNIHKKLMNLRVCYAFQANPFFVSFCSRMEVEEDVKPPELEYQPPEVIDFPVSDGPETGTDDQHDISASFFSPEPTSNVIQEANPWEVDSVKQFLFYCCPECPYSAKAISPFVEHAVDNHPKAKKYFEDNPGEKEEHAHGFDHSEYRPQRKHCQSRFFTADGQPIMVKAEPRDLDKVARILTRVQASSRGRLLKLKKKRITTRPADSNVNANESLEKDVKPVKKYTCDQCSEGYNKLYALAMHLNLIHDVGTGAKIPCPACKLVFRGAPRLKAHIEFEHEGISSTDGHSQAAPGPVFKCDVEGCNYEAKLKQNLDNHKFRKHSPEENQVLKCEAEGCTYETNRKSCLQSHTNFYHGPKKEQCDLCGETFRYKSLLQRHRQTVHLQLRDHICHKCGKAFNHDSGLKQHWKQSVSCDVMTRKDMTFNCDRCPDADTFNSIKGYIFHYRKAHNGFPTNIDTTGLKLYYCDQCTEVYTNSLTLWRHKKVVHEGRTECALKKQAHVKQTCTYCGKQIYRGTQMTEHVKSKHENDTPYKCDQCPKSFGTNTFLRQHITQVHRKLTCNLCGKEICNKLWFKRHMAKVHGVVEDNAFQCDKCTIVFETMDAKIRHMMKQHS